MSNEKRIVVDNGDGTVAVVIPAPGYTMAEVCSQPDVAKLLASKPHQEVDAADLPADRTFRDAWCPCAVKGARVDVERAKGLCHNQRRAVRAAEFAPLDQAIAAKIPGTDEAEVESKRQAIRDKHADFQVRIDAAETEEELKAVLAEMADV